MLRIITFNANGIRAAVRRGFFPWMLAQKADVICIQETKAQEAQLAAEEFCPKGYHCYYCDAEKKGYSGVAIYTRKIPDTVIKGFGLALAEQEGRYIEAHFGPLRIASIYFPSGTRGDERQQIKYQFLDYYYAQLQQQKKQPHSFILCGDWNMAHKKIDIENWRGNQRNSGFLPEERAWMDKVLEKDNYVDAFRVVDSRAKQYTWWSTRGQAWEKNVGWRLDYQVVSPEIADKIISATIYKEQRFSDHAPLMVDYQLNLAE